LLTVDRKSSGASFSIGNPQSAISNQEISNPPQPNPDVETLSASPGRCPARTAQVTLQSAGGPFAEKQTWGPGRSGVSASLGAGGLGDERFAAVQTAVHHLGAQHAFKPSSDNQHGGAVHQGPEGQHEAGVLARGSAQTLRQALAEEVERGPRLVEGGGLSDAIEQNSVGVAMGEGELELPLASLAKGTGAAECGEQIIADLQAESVKNVFAVMVALVDGGGGGAGGFGHGAHGERFFAAPVPQPAGGVENALFEFRVRLSGHQPPSTSARLSPGPNNLHYVKLTMYNP